MFVFAVDTGVGEKFWLGTKLVGNSAYWIFAVGVLLVVHVYREEHNGEEIIRIISARAAEKHELRRYTEQATD